MERALIYVHISLGYKELELLLPKKARLNESKACVLYHHHHHHPSPPNWLQGNVTTNPTYK
jgi:hypothetical protein